MFINYAHRGASARAPENTMRAFALGVEQGANGIETDIRRTRDGVLVLFHDEDLYRLTGRTERIADLTFKELSRVEIPSPIGGKADTVPELTRFLSFAKPLPVSLALELKDDGLEREVTQAIRDFGVGERCVVTSFSMERLSRVRALEPALRVGLLTRSVDCDLVRELRRIGAQQICPHAAILTPELVRSLHAQGFSVRAWGVKDEQTMRFAFRCGVDGMTVNFPDQLRELLQVNGVM